MPFTTFQSPIGSLTLLGDGRRLRRLYFPRRAPGLDEQDHAPRSFVAVIEQLEQYFAGEREAFTVELELAGTPFQRAVWRELQRIPYGSTTTYGALARRIGAGSSAGAGDARAVGAAVGATPTPIVIPCHRVIGADGSLTGYGGGLHRKRALLDFEAAGGDRGALDAAWRQRQLALL